ncbi:hypothetical protein [Rhodococcus sp. Z13]|uniref:hypothetical protein n=1 Tax=Rhodococcus sacchari TaxID=2962047 RepID=UPI00298FA7FF|nr:hypothetical protein [Rhodococcus sp. Z13]
MTDRPDPGTGDLGGDPVCWLHLVCPDCGAFRESPDEPCPRCGSTTVEPGDGSAAEPPSGSAG